MSMTGCPAGSVISHLTLVFSSPGAQAWRKGARISFRWTSSLSQSGRPTRRATRANPPSNMWLKLPSSASATSDGGVHVMLPRRMRPWHRHGRDFRRSLDLAQRIQLSLLNQLMPTVYEIYKIVPTWRFPLVLSECSLGNSG